MGIPILHDRGYLGHLGLLTLWGGVSCKQDVPQLTGHLVTVRASLLRTLQNKQQIFFLNVGFGFFHIICNLIMFICLIKDRKIVLHKS